MANSSILSITNGDKLSIKYLNTDEFSGTITLGGMTKEQHILFLKIQEGINALLNFQREGEQLAFSLNKISLKAKTNEYIFGGSLKVNKYSQAYPSVYSVPCEIKPEILESLLGKIGYYFAAGQQDVSVTVEALFMSFDIQTFITVMLEESNDPQLKMEFPDTTVNTIESAIEHLGNKKSDNAENN